MNTMVNGFDGDISGLSDTQRALIARRDRALGPAYRLFYEVPIEIVRGEGVWLYDATGRRYLDAYNNVASLGHCHPIVVDAIARQSAILTTHTRYLATGIVDYAEALLAEFPDQLEHVMFTCTGSEANDLALRIARIATGGDGVIVTANAYHGVTAAIAAASPSFGPSNPIGPNVWVIPAPTRSCTDVAFAAGVAEAVMQMRTAGVRPAALLLDTIFSSDGVFANPPGFLQAAVASIRREGGLFIADEVQAGFGRTGSGMWGFERHGLVPDLITLGKPMGNGYPIAGVVGQAKPIEAFARATRYFNTFGGNSVACAAGSAVLRVIHEEGLLGNCARIGALLREGAASLASRFDVITDVRAAGLFIGIELAGANAKGTAVATQVVNALREAGVLISAAGRYGNVLKLRPPLVFQPNHADLLLSALEAALRTV